MNARFITGRTSLQQNSSGKYYTKHNQLFIDEDNTILLVPRNELTDGYSYPLGGKMACWDIRPAIGHDLECRYHQRIVVKLSLYELISQGYVKNKNIDGFGILVCKNIPEKFLQVEDVTFTQANARFKRMMKACGISKFWQYAMFFGVHLNVGWLNTGKIKFDMDKIYERNN